jgi:nitric oxide reductase large subunit
METLVWLRVPGDIVFAFGALFLAVYAAKLLRRPPRAVVHVQPVAQAGDD